MPIDFGLLMPFGLERGGKESFLNQIGRYAPGLAGHVQSLWMTDHFFYGDAPTYEAWTVLTYLAAAFPDYQVGSLVMGQRYRNPALVAKMGATLQELSGGRFILGMGAGWKEDEHLAYGYDFPSAGTRIQQLEEAVIIIKRLWYDRHPISYYGRHYRIHNAYCEPKPNPVPPIMIGGSGQKTLRVTAQHANWWNDSAKTPELYRERLAVLHQHCDYLGRHPEEIRLTWLGGSRLARKMLITL
jgi:alkanesulfonate monooxygenase SsuD/methylene tetrahydromethanopterin reductase-like flavin-dependent oxidoreductase (luciferase family)